MRERERVPGYGSGQHWSLNGWPSNSRWTFFDVGTDIQCCIVERCGDKQRLSAVTCVTRQVVATTLHPGLRLTVWRTFSFNDLVCVLSFFTASGVMFVGPGVQQYSRRAINSHRNRRHILTSGANARVDQGTAYRLQAIHNTLPLYCFLCFSHQT